MINVNRGAESLGVFSEEDVREGLRSGRFVPTDLGWREGMESWQTLAQFPEFAEAIGTTAPGAGPTVAPGGEVLAPALRNCSLRATVGTPRTAWAGQSLQRYADHGADETGRSVSGHADRRGSSRSSSLRRYRREFGLHCLLPLYSALRLIWNDGRATEPARRNVRRSDRNYFDDHFLSDPNCADVSLSARALFISV